MHSFENYYKNSLFYAENIIYVQKNHVEALTALTKLRKFI